MTHTIEIDPETQVVVPREPTQEMIDAGYDALDENSLEYEEDLGVVQSWKAMLKMSPAVQPAPVGDEDQPCLSCGAPSNVDCGEDAHMCWKCHSEWLAHQVANLRALIEVGGLDQRTINLVLAAREAAYGDELFVGRAALDKAAEAFAEDVPWDEQPEDA